MTLLSFERSGAAYIGAARRLLDDIVDYATRQMYGEKLYAQDHILRHRLAEMAIHVEVSRLLAYRVAWMQDNGLVPEAEGGMVKVGITETLQELANIGMQMLGLFGQLPEASKWTQLRGSIWHSYVCSIGAKIAAGTSEIQRNIIALRGLEMPR